MNSQLKVSTSCYKKNSDINIIRLSLGCLGNRNDSISTMFFKFVKLYEHLIPYIILKWNPQKRVFNDFWNRCPMTVNQIHIVLLKEWFSKRLYKAVMSLNCKHCIQDYFRVVFFSPFFTCQWSCSVLNSSRYRYNKERSFETFEFAQSSICPLTKRA